MHRPRRTRGLREDPPAYSTHRGCTTHYYYYKRTDKFWICLDKATVHNEVVQVVGTKAKLWPQPPHSPDCNKPIEHVHAQVDAGVHAWLLDTRQHHPSHTITVEESKAKVEEVFYSIPTSSIKADVESLPSTWEAIIADHGGFVASKLS